MTNRAETGRGTTYRNLMLTAICGFLGVIAMRGAGPGAVSEAVAAEPPNVPNAFAQRLQIVEELKELKNITAKLTSIEKTVNTRLSAIEDSMVEQASMAKAEQREKRLRGKEGNVE